MQAIRSWTTVPPFSREGALTCPATARAVPKEIHWDRALFLGAVLVLSGKDLRAFASPKSQPETSCVKQSAY